MALVIEDGSLVANANSFASRAEIISYAADRGVALADDETTDVLGIKAMDFIRTQCYRGILVEGAVLPYPRYGLVDGDDAVGYVYTIPANLKLAQMQLALDVHNGIDLTPSDNPGPATKRSKVGPIEEEFFAPGSSTLDGAPPLTVAMSYLRGFLCSQGSPLSVYRA